MKSKTNVVLFTALFMAWGIYLLVMSWMNLNFDPVVYSGYIALTVALNRTMFYSIKVMKGSNTNVTKYILFGTELLVILFFVFVFMFEKEVAEYNLLAIPAMLFALYQVFKVVRPAKTLKSITKE